MGMCLFWCVFYVCINADVSLLAFLSTQMHVCWGVSALVFICWECVSTNFYLNSRRPG
jgi:hypothetical protein